MKQIEQDIFQAGELLPLVEDFYTLQGEGYHTGKAAYFIRIGGCDVGCRWCDARFTWNKNVFAPVAIQTIVDRASVHPARSIVITGGEPTLYPLAPLTKKLKAQGFEIFIETSGTNPISGDIDWVCLSPKPQQPPLDEAFERADELKVIVCSEQDFEWGEQCAKKVGANCKLYFQPEWSVRKIVTDKIVEYVKQHPEWQISLQTHKFLNIP